MERSLELAALLRRERQALLDRWRQGVTATSPARAGDAPLPDVPVPDLIEALIDALEHDEDARTAASGAPHAPARSTDEFDVEQVVFALSILRTELIELAADNGLPLRGRLLRLVNRAIDQAIAECMRRSADQTTSALERDQEAHLAYVAHDLRVPLGALAMAVEVLARSLPPEQDPGALTPRMLRTLRSNIERLTSLVANVLEVSVGGADDAAQLKGSRMRLRPLVDRLVQGLDAAAGDSGTRVLVDVAPDLEVWGERRLLERALQNLLANAIQHGAPGTLRISAERSGDMIQCHVSDTGGGVPVERFAGLLERDASADGDEQHGLGLVITRRFIEQHGGRIALEHLGDDGTAFRIDLPARRPG